MSSEACLGSTLGPPAGTVGASRMPRTATTGALGLLRAQPSKFSPGQLSSSCLTTSPGLFQVAFYQFISSFSSPCNYFFNYFSVRQCIQG